MFAHTQRSAWTLAVHAVMLIAVVAGLGQAAQAALSARDDRAALQAQLARTGTARVIVELAAPASATGSTSEIARASGIARARFKLKARMKRLGRKLPDELKTFFTMPLVATSVDAETLTALAADPSVVGVYVDELAVATLGESSPLIGVPQASLQGFDGSRTVVAIADTGVDRSHPFFGGRVRYEACFSTTDSFTGSTSFCPPGSAENDTGVGAPCPSFIPGCDHGTHVAGIAAGSGENFTGVAPGADILAIQVFSRFDGSICTDYGYSSPCTLSFTSDQLAALDYVYRKRDIIPTVAVNFSLGGPASTDPQTGSCDGHLLTSKVAQLRAAGIAVVAASGNGGSSTSIDAPACISDVISVGSTDELDQISWFSNTSIALDLLAPGAVITSSVPGGGFGSKQGTSMAAPQVTGAMAVLRTKDVVASVDALQDALELTGIGLPAASPVFPRIQVDGALESLALTAASLTVTPAGSLTAEGVEGEPPSPASFDVTLTNQGLEPLDFSAAVGSPWVTVNPETGTIASGGSVIATVSFAGSTTALEPGTFVTSLVVDNVTSGFGNTSRNIELTVLEPPPPNDLRITLTADNGEAVWFNGAAIGTSSDWTQASSYVVALQNGVNVIAVRASDAGGVAGLLAELALPDGSVVVSDSTWKVSTTEQPGWQQTTFDDSAWASATEHGAYGVNPWNTNVNGFDAASNARWIWSANNDSDNVLFVRYTVVVGPETVAVATSTLPNATVGESYTAVLLANAGAEPYAWALEPGTGKLPQGLYLASNGAITGTPTQSGTETFTVRVTDSNGDSATLHLTLMVSEPPPPSEVALTITLTADNGEEVWFNGVSLGTSSDWTQASSYVVALQSGVNVIAVRASDAGGVAGLLAELALPDGSVVVSDSTWKVATTEQPGWQQSTFDVSAWANATEYGSYGISPWSTNVNGFNAASSARWIWSANNDTDNVLFARYTIIVGPETVAVATTTLPDAMVGETYTAALLANAGAEPYAWALEPGTGTLPQGLYLASNGAITGTPTQSGAETFTVRVTDSNGDSATLHLTLMVSEPPPPSEVALTITLTADNGEEVWFNGVPLGTSSDWTQASSYVVALQSGVNVIAVRATDAGGVAGLLAELALPDGSVVVSDSTWKVSTTEEPGWQQSTFDDSAWANATEYGSYGVGPWYTNVNGFNAASSARWIWTGNNDAHNGVFARYAVVLDTATVSVATATLPDAKVDQSYSAVLLATAGAEPYAWALEPGTGTLPQGLYLASNGAITGIPTHSGAETFTVRVTDSNGDSSTRQLTLPVSEPAPPPEVALTITLTADNGEEIWFNGGPLGTSSDWKEASSYVVALQSGVNVIAVRASDAGGVAGLLAELTLPDGSVVVSDSTWRVSTTEQPGWQQSTFDDSAWANATEYGSYGVGPWNTSANGFDATSNARWIWSINNYANNDVFIRYSLTTANQ